MTNLRDAAQALLDAVDARHDQPAPLKYAVPYGAVVALRTALSTPQPTAVMPNIMCAELDGPGMYMSHCRGDGIELAAPQPAMIDSAERTYTHAEVCRMMNELSDSAKAYGLEVVTTITGPDTTALGLRRIDPQPAADERVAEHIRTVAKACAASRSVGIAAAMNRDQLGAAYVEESAALAAVESSARALLAAGWEDAALFEISALEHALERLVNRCNADAFLATDEAVIHAEATLERLYIARRLASSIPGQT